MSKQFWSFLLVGLAIVGVAVAMIWSGTKPNHLVIDTKVLNVRTVPIGEGREIIIVDFRVTNPTAVPLVLRDVSMRLELYGQEPMKGLEISRGDIDTMFQLHPMLGARDNDVLAPPDTIGPGQTVYRMAEASFDVPQSAVSTRKNIVVHLEDVDGAAFDISEKNDTPEKKDDKK